MQGPIWANFMEGDLQHTSHSIMPFVGVALTMRIIARANELVAMGIEYKVSPFLVIL